MADIEIRTGEFSVYRNTLLREHDLLKVILWDCGPEKPVFPTRPDAPHGKQGDPLFDLAMVDFRDLLEKYEADVKAFKRQQAEFDDWQNRIGGPVERLFWSCDAGDALRYDADAVRRGQQEKRRYFISSKTRGYGHLPNGGLPEDMKPGRGQQAALDQQAADDHAMALARQNDPVFGGTE
jgi:hypothetical protein